MGYMILVVNPGSTSTKITAYENEMEALAMSGLRILREEEEAKIYG